MRSDQPPNPTRYMDMPEVSGASSPHLPVRHCWPHLVVQLTLCPQRRALSTREANPNHTLPMMTLHCPDNCRQVEKTDQLGTRLVHVQFEGSGELYQLSINKERDLAWLDHIFKTLQITTPFVVPRTAIPAKKGLLRFDYCVDLKLGDDKGHTPSPKSAMNSALYFMVQRLKAYQVFPTVRAFSYVSSHAWVSQGRAKVSVGLIAIQPFLMISCCSFPNSRSPRNGGPK